MTTPPAAPTPRSPTHAPTAGPRRGAATACASRPFPWLELSYAELYFVGAESVFGRLPASVRYVELTGAAAGFPFGEVAGLKRLRSLDLKGVSAAIDCRGFLATPELAELAFFGCNRIEHVDALLALDGLRELWFMNCKAGRARPVLEGALKASFVEHGFDFLGLDLEQWGQRGGQATTGPSRRRKTTSSAKAGAERTTPKPLKPTRKVTARKTRPKRSQ